MADTFSGWFIQELEQRELSYRKFAERIGVSATSITDLANEKMKPSPDMCQKIARAFGLQPEAVFRKAGLLPPAPEETVTSREMIYMFLQLDEDDQEHIMDITRTFLEKRRVIIGGEKPTNA